MLQLRTKPGFHLTQLNSLTDKKSMFGSQRSKSKTEQNAFQYFVFIQNIETRPDTRPPVADGRAGAEMRVLPLFNSSVTDRPTDRPTDRRTDKASYRVACPQLKRYKMRATRKMERSKSVTFFFGCNFGEIICCFFFYGVNGRCHGVKTKTDLNWSYSGDITCSLHYLTSPKLSHNIPFF